MSTSNQIAMTLAVSASLAFAAPASAQDVIPSPEEAAEAFKAICMDHAGDHMAQAKAATAAPWNMKKAKDSNDKRAYYDNFPWQLSLSTTDSGLKICAVTTAGDPGLTDAQARSATVAVLGPRPADLEEEKGGYYWTPSIDGRDYMIMYQTKIFPNDGNPMTVVSYGLTWK
ncbi:hypothetical protein [Novosphingobium sp.]|uniref:hypothetical protein n=1 Tax=Novosphingobium sp. TaxID=1874826 RepID=UPI00286B0A6B|nr:hypothetical protein [Novosphingobium sp.]